MSATSASLAGMSAGPERRRLALALWGAGMLGVLALVLFWLPVAIGKVPQPLPMPMWVLMLISGAQSAGLLALAVWAGLSCAARVGLRAPAFEAWAARGDVAAALRPQWLPGLLAGLVGGAGLYATQWFAPTAIQEAAATTTPPLALRLLYGGVTEELLLRWGLMSWLLWAMWRVFQRGQGRPGAFPVGSAILLSALLFGIGHLPAAYSMVGHLDARIVLYIVGANTAFGLLFGALYRWRGLESAMLAHFGAHAVAAALLALTAG